MSKYSEAPIPNPCYVMQDGNVFYLYRNNDRRNLVAIREAPFPVRDFDMKWAIQARNWFANGEAIDVELHWDRSGGQDVQDI
jgi:ribosomal protein L24E